MYVSAIDILFDVPSALPLIVSIKSPSVSAVFDKLEQVTLFPSTVIAVPPTLAQATRSVMPVTLAGISVGLIAVLRRCAGSRFVPSTRLHLP